MALEHPALKNFSPTWEGIKHFGKTMLKGAAYGAAGLAALSFIVPVTPLVTLIGALTPSFLGGSAAGAFVATILPIMKAGAIAGGAIGAVSGVAGVGKAIREGQEDAIDDYDRNLLARERAVLLARGRGQSFANSEVAVGNVAYRAPVQSQGRTVG